jgi:hypothetical protein
MTNTWRGNKATLKGRVSQGNWESLIYCGNALWNLKTWRTDGVYLHTQMMWLASRLIYKFTITWNKCWQGLLTVPASHDCISLLFWLVVPKGEQRWVRWLHLAKHFGDMIHICNHCAYHRLFYPLFREGILYHKAPSLSPKDCLFVFWGGEEFPFLNPSSCIL